MKFISHRGNIHGPQPDEENTFDYIDEAIALGYDVEVDLRWKNGQFYLGHDFAQEPSVSLEWIYDRQHFLWLHCKDIDCFSIAPKAWRKFCHISDPAVVVTPDFLWIHDLSMELNWKCIIPLLTKEDIDNFDLERTRSGDCYGICTDYPMYLERERNGI